MRAVTVYRVEFAKMTKYPVGAGVDADKVVMK